MKLVRPLLLLIIFFTMQLSFSHALASALLVADYVIELRTKGPLPKKTPKITLQLISNRVKPPEEIKFSFKKQVRLKNFEFAGDIKKLLVKVDCTNADPVDIESITVVLKNINPNPSWVAFPRLHVNRNSTLEGTYEVQCGRPLKL